MENNKTKIIITSDQNNKFELIFENENNNLFNIYVNSIDSIFNQQYEKASFTLNDMKLNKYFESFENINEIYDELSNKLKDSYIIENTNELIISIPLNTNKIKEILFKINEEIKTNEESISELYRINKNLFKKINILESKIENINKELNECKNKNQKLELKNKEIIDNLNILNNYKIEKEKKDLSKTLIYSKDLKKSEIIKENEISIINNWISPNFYINYELLYKATIDGDTISKFHDKCDNKGETICFIKLKNNFRIGGYTSKSWNYKINNFINDDNTFIFDLNNKKKYLPTENKCIYSSKKGFSFGDFNIGINKNNFLNKQLITSFNNKYYDDFEEFQKNKLYKLKIILFGDTFVGKTSIINNLILKNNKNDHPYATIGVDFKILEFILSNDYKIKLILCDTAGPERFRTLTETFVKKNDAIIMCYDITNYNSFLKMKNDWYEKIKPNCKQNKVIGIIGNKCDLLEEKTVNDDEAIKFAKEINASFTLVSFKSYKETENLINNICLKIIDNNRNNRNIFVSCDENYNITEMEVYKVNLIK